MQGEGGGGGGGVLRVMGEGNKKEGGNLFYLCMDIIQF